MNLEGITIKLLTIELNKEILGAKIFKVYMPSQHSLLLALQCGAQKKYLLAAFDGATPALYLTDSMPERPAEPPTFCMLLRKHLEDSRITSVTQTGLDRIITLEMSSIGAGQQIVTQELIFELTGKNSNIILTSNSTIINCLKKVGKAINSYRQLYPGMPYQLPPPQTGLSILDTAPQDIVAAIKSAASDNLLVNKLVNATTGIGKQTAQELLVRAAIPLTATHLSCKEESDLVQAICHLQAEFALCAKAEAMVHAQLAASNTIKAIVPYLPQAIKQNKLRSFASVNAALMFAEQLTPLQLPQEVLLRKPVTTEIARLSKKLALLKDELLVAEDCDSERIKADSLMAGIYQLSKGQSSCCITNIYDGTQMQLSLSPLLTPIENAQAYYKRYNKLKRAQSELQQQIANTQELLSYLTSIEASFATANTKAELEEIKAELVAIGLIKQTGKKIKAATEKSQPLKIVLNADTFVYVGKNNKQNDYVTFTLGKPQDLWLHVKGSPGSHVILKTTLPQPARADIEAAAQIAAYYSKARQSNKTEVDYTFRKYVKKPSGAKPGFVIYTEQTTLYVEPKTRAE